MTTAPTSYTIRVHGHLTDDWSSRPDTDVRRLGDGSTALTITVVDQASLHSLLTRLRDAGTSLLELRSHDQADAPVPALDRTLHTARLTLRPASVADTLATWQYRQLDTVNEWLTGSPPEPDDYALLFAEPGRLATTVVVLLGHGPDATVIGDFMLRRTDAWAQRDVADQAKNAEAEFGWVLDPAHTGHGYATEAVQALIQHCFDDLGIHRITATSFLENETSTRLMERVGMRREMHARRDSLHRSGQWHDTLGYAVLRDDWYSYGR